MELYDDIEIEDGIPVLKGTFNDTEDQEEVFKEMEKRMQGATLAGMPDLYVREKAEEARMNETYESSVGAIQNSLVAPYLANIDTVNKKLIDLKRRYPGLSLSAFQRFENSKIQNAVGRTLPPGSVFRGTNGGYYVTLGNSANGMMSTYSSGIEGLSLPNSETPQDYLNRTGSAAGYKEGLFGGESIDAKVLAEEGVDFMQWDGAASVFGGGGASYGKGTSAKNAGYRELTAEEAEMVKQIDSQLMLTKPRSEDRKQDAPGHI